MRNLTIKRTKSFVGCLAKMKVYIEDPDSSEIRINNTPCRKIGELKNGEEKTFSVSEQECKVFMIADKISKDYCNEFYRLPAGTENVYLSGKNKFNPATGNAFRFDNNENEESVEFRKRSSVKGIVVLISACIVGALIGYAFTSFLFSSKNPEPKEFSSSGMSITLTDEFSEADIADYTVTYDSRNIAVFALKEEFSLVEGLQDYTLEEYGDLIIQSNGLSSKVKNYDGLTGFEREYTNPDTLDTYKYFAFIYKSNDAFWMIQFATLKENADEYRATIVEWAKTASFD